MLRDDIKRPLVVIVDFFPTDTRIYRTKLFISLRMFVTQHLNDLNMDVISRFRSSVRSNVAQRHFRPSYRTIMAVPREMHEFASSHWNTFRRVCFTVSVPVR